jgi:hypothetical protein
MTDRQLFEETFSRLHASEDTITEVFKMAREQDHRKMRRMPARTGALIALAAALLMTTAFAAAANGFFGTVFGTKGQENVEAHEVTEPQKGSTYEVPAMEWVDVDETQAEELVGEYVAAVGTSVSVGDWTLTVDDYTIDDRGIGAIVYTLSNPNGMGDTIRDAGYGEYYVGGNNPDGLREIGLEGDWDGGGMPHMFDTRNIVDLDLTTETELHAVMYFAPFYRYEAGESIHMTLQRVVGDIPTPEEDAMGVEPEWEEQTITFRPESFIPSRAFQSEDGYTAHVSPMGIFFDNFFEGADPAAYLRELSVAFDDGTEYVLKSEDPYVDNQIVSCGSDMDDVEATVFNRLVDADSVVSLTRNGGDGATIVYTPAD